MKPMSSMRSASSRTRNSTSAEAQRIALDEIKEPTRRGDKDIDAVEQRANLGAHRHAADGKRRPDAQMAAIGAEAVENLPGQFTRRAEHQDAAALVRDRPRVGGQMMQDRQREGCGLAGAGLRNSDHIAARHDDRYRLCLDRRRGEIFFFGEGAGDGVVKSEVLEVGQRGNFLYARWRGRCAMRRGRFCG